MTIIENLVSLRLAGKIDPRPNALAFKYGDTVEIVVSIEGKLFLRRDALYAGLQSSFYPKEPCDAGVRHRVIRLNSAKEFVGDAPLDISALKFNDVLLTGENMRDDRSLFTELYSSIEKSCMESLKDPIITHDVMRLHRLSLENITALPAALSAVLWPYS